MPNPFTITAATNTIRLDDTRQAQTTFTVFNSSGRAMRGRARIVVQNPASETWVSLVGDAEKDFPIAGTHQYDVKIAVPAGSPPGSYPFRLDVVGTENPDEEFSQGPTVTFEVPAPAPAKNPFPIWIPIALVAVLLLVGGVIAFLLLRGPGGISPANATSTAVALQESADATSTAVARNAADQTSTAVADELQAARGTATAVASFTYDFIAHADDATWQLYSSEETGSFSATLQLDWFIDGDENGFAIWRDSRYQLNDGSTPPLFLETRPPSLGIFGRITACYDVVYPSGSRVQPTDRISGKIGHIKGDADTAALFIVFVTDANAQQTVLFSDIHNYSEGVRAFDIPIATNFTGEQIEKICLRVSTVSPKKVGDPSWIDVKITR
jgi:hypothetical protein